MVIFHYKPVLTCIKHPLLGAVDPSPRRCLPGAGQMPLLRAVVARGAADHGEGLTHPLTPKRGFEDFMVISMGSIGRYIWVIEIVDFPIQNGDFQ